jgi:hypothetical protein
MVFHDIGLFIDQYFFQWKKLHSGEQKEKNDQNKKKYELKPKRKFCLSGNQSFVV